MNKTVPWSREGGITYSGESTTNPIHLKQTEIVPNVPMDAKPTLGSPTILAIIPGLASISKIHYSTLVSPNPLTAQGQNMLYHILSFREQYLYS